MQIIQVINGVFTARDDNNTGIAYFFTIIHIPEVNTGLSFKRIEVCKIGDVWKTNNSEINFSISP